MIKVSVIIPTFGVPIFLRDAIESVLKQSVKWELIIVDDNNPNTEARVKTEALVMEYVRNDERISYIKHECNKNGAVARNTGLAVAKGKYISFLDSDDEYMPNRLRKCFNLMEEASLNIAGVYTGCEFRKGGRTYHIERNVRAGNYLLETLACTFMFCTGSNIFVRKTVIDELEGFDELFLRHQDYEFLVRLFKRYDIGAIPEVLVIKNNENINAPNLERTIKIKKQYIEKFKPTIDSLSDKYQNQIFHSQYIGIAEVAMRNKQYKEAVSFYKKAKEYGSLTMRELVRMFLFPIYNCLQK